VARHFGRLAGTRDQRIDSGNGKLKLVRVYELPEPEAAVVQLEQAKANRKSA
jgi:hypothetical protein